MKIKIAIISYLLGAWLSVCGQGDRLFIQHKFHRLDESHKLSNNVINDIAQDSLGYIWVATEGGLLRYQGFEFKTYRKDRSNPNSLPHNLVYKVYVDDENQVWALTEQGVAIYSYETDEVFRYLPDQLSVGITSMAKSSDGQYYFGSYTGGLWTGVDSLKNIPLVTTDGKADLSLEGISNIEIGEEYLWISFNLRGMLQYHLKTHEVIYHGLKPSFNLDRAEFYDFIIDQDQVIWIASNLGLLRMKPGEDGAYHYERVLRTLPFDDYLSIHLDDNGQLWLGSRQNGMYTIDAKELTVIQHFEPQSDDSGISHRTISNIFRDNSGLMWLGTHNGGLNDFDPEGEQVRYLTHSPVSSNSLSYESVWGISPSRDGGIWVGTDGKGLNYLDPKTGKIEPKYEEELKNRAILCAFEDNQSRLWLGTYEHGLYMIDAQGHISNFTTRSANSELIGNDIRVVHQTLEGQILIGANGVGLYHFDEEKEEVVMVDGGSGLDIRSIISIDEKLIYLGSFRSGFLRADKTQGGWRIERVKVPQIVGRMVISDIKRYKSKLLLATRENGLVTYDMLSEQFDFFPDQSLLRDIAVSGVALDRQGNVWLTSNSGIYSYNFDTDIVTQFDEMDGVQPGHFNYGSLFISDQGYLVAGGIHGMNLFYTEELLEEPPIVPVIFNELKVLNEKVTPINSDYFESGKSIFLTDKVVLSHTDNVFSLSYSIPGFNIGKQNKFEYKLEGYDTDWQTNNEINEATYRNVPFGHYTFRVKSIYDDKISNSLKVEVATPLWRTWEAYFLFMLVIAFLLWRFIKFNNVRVVLRQQLKFEKELREKDHNVMQEKLRFYTNFSHELKTPLTLIQGPVNDLIKKEKDPEHLYYLQLIKKNTSILLKFIGRMLEFRKVEMNKTIFNIGKHDLNILAQEEAESFGYLAREKGIQFGFYSENNLNAWVDIEKIQIVMNNLLSNAIKFSESGKKVQFGVFKEEEVFVIEVKDQGEGINPSEIDNIFSPFYQASNSVGSGGTGIGLALSKNFVESHGGTIEVESGRDGTVFRVEIPVGKEHLEGKDHVRFISSEPSELLEIEKIAESFVIDGRQETIGDADRVMLVVDDNKDISRYISSLFSSEFKVILAEDGIEAFNQAVSSMPDIIISDMMMPGLDGIGLCKKLKHNIATSHVPIILLTAKNSNKSKIDGFEVGADDYITKPFDSELLKVRVANILSRRKLLHLKYTTGDLVVSKDQQVSKEEEFVLHVEATIISMLSASEFNVPDLCKELGMSQTSLYRKIKSLTDDSIQVFIRKIKIKRAAHLLVSEDLTVAEVAMAMNFSDLKYFRKCFKEQFDMTPSEYKNSRVENSHTI
ncbi:hybrid sensor histidine kinase/response regulator transcription factor [Reichenbachiella ulvae]|uniref:histidine kinase n=1 Tax=Reichenbachiella ulvae TaxID=2980104 RepID=A0ABT3CUM6_9BACT|nr:two-component regulator propeller domain-containing protein [Reichenbachiella ulvae]MCV9387378.1 response regulator [Reichenbachiella ulvae]